MSHGFGVNIREHFGCLSFPVNMLEKGSLGFHLTQIDFSGFLLSVWWGLPLSEWRGVVRFPVL